MRNHHADALEWIAANPKAWNYLKYLALEASESGNKFGMKALVERARWEFRVSVKYKGEYKINNNHTSYLARALVKEMPELASKIELRGVSS